MIKYTSQNQLQIPGFESPFTKKMNPNNRWIKLSALIPWDELVSQYSRVMREDFGRPGINPRVVIGSLIIKHICGFSDEETVEHISENIYMQCFLGYQGFNDKQPFDPSLFVHIRKRVGVEVFEQMNRSILVLAGLIEEPEEEQGKDEGEEGGGGSSPTHKGRVLFDATVCPQDIKYPNDLELISDARKKSEELIDRLYEKSLHDKKPRTDRKRARKEFLMVAKKKSKSRKTLRKAIRKQLGYLRRNIRSIDRLLDGYERIPLSMSEYKYMLVIRELYCQQQQMYDEKSRRIPNRIVSIHQPHVRPMVRGKASAKVEFGSKISLSLVEGYAMVDRLNWDAFHEGNEMMDYIARYKDRFGFYPKEVAVDKLYTSRENRKRLKEMGIKLIGKPLGRPPKGERFEVDPGIRNPIEGKFGQGKRAYRLGRVYAKLKDTSESWIAAAFFVMNLLKLVKQSQLSWLQTILRGLTRKLQWSVTGIYAELITFDVISQKLGFARR
jgi:hypothetical protein